MGELEAVSYQDVDALLVMSPSDYPFRAFAYPGLTDIVVDCARGGHSKEPGGPAGWAYPIAPENVDQLFFNAEQNVIESFRTRYERDFCAIGSSAAQTLAAIMLLAPTLNVPVLLVYGDHDTYLAGAPEFERLRFLGSSDVTLHVMPDTGHNLMLQRTAPQFRALVSEWLTARGF